MTPPVHYHAEILREFLLEQHIATMAELKQAISTKTDLTILRKLKELEYHTSYSHNGRYYTLREIVQFDKLGLWSFNDVWFSKYGTLVQTIEFLVETSDTGYFNFELEVILNVSVKDTLRKLFEQKRLLRQQFGKYWLYCSKDPHRFKQQTALRMEDERRAEEDIFPDELKATIVLFFSLLDEKRRRLFAGLESLKWGYGGDRKIANLLGLDEKTVARGRNELLSQDVKPYGGVRASGGGRKSIKKGHQK